MSKKIRYQLVGIAGLAGSGKSLAAQALEDHLDFCRVSFATPLKDMLKTLGVSSADKQATPDVLCGRTVRYALQTLGTEWGRNLIGPDLWVRAAMEYASHRLPVVIDDVRFDNEAQAIREAGGVLLQILRPGSEAMSHASEAGVSRELINLSYWNDGTPEDLARWIVEWMTNEELQ